MKSDTRQIVEIAGILGVIASLVFVGMQLILDRRVAKVDAYQNLVEQYNDIEKIRATDSLFAVLDYKVRQEEDLTVTELNQWRSYHRLAIRHSDMAFLQFQNDFINEQQLYGFTGPLRGSLRRDFQKEWWTVERCRDYSIEFARYITRIMAELEPEHPFWKESTCE